MAYAFAEMARPNKIPDREQWNSVRVAAARTENHSRQYANTIRNHRAMGSPVWPLSPRCSCGFKPRTVSVWIQIVAIANSLALHKGTCVLNGFFAVYILNSKYFEECYQIGLSLSMVVLLLGVFFVHLSAYTNNKFSVEMYKPRLL